MNFIASYLKYNEGNEVNTSYHQWCALSALASAASRKVWIDMGYFVVYPNLYVVLLGPPGNGKTTGMNIMARMLTKVGSIPMSADCQSAQDIVKMLSAPESQVSFILPNGEPFIYTPHNLFLTELSNFVAIDPANMIDFLVTIYDKEDRYAKRTLRHGEQVIIAPFFNMLACTVPDTIVKYFKNDIVSGGFSRRAVFILEDYKEDRRVPRPVVTPEQQKAHDECVAWCMKLQTVGGKFTMTPEADKWWDRWYKTRIMTNDPNLANFDRTKPTQLLKLAMLLQLGRSLELTIDVEILETGLAMLDQIIIRLPEIFAFVGRNELAHISGKLEGMLRRAGAPMPEREVIGRLWRDATTAETLQIIMAMVENGRLVRIPETRTLALPEQVAEAVRVQKLKELVHEPPAQTGTGSVA
jgi:energy-coupling factor transporter ATP-binding protein EcfA2